jgi:hypothetical protein
VAALLLQPARFAAPLDFLTSEESLRYPNSMTAQPDVYVELIQRLLDGKVPFTSAQDSEIASPLRQLLHGNFPEWQTATPDLVAELGANLLRGLDTVRWQGRWVH